MGRKIFVSYKYGDTQVQDLNIYENTFLEDKRSKQKPDIT